MQGEPDYEKTIGAELEYLAFQAARLDPGATVGVSWTKRVGRHSARVEFTDGFVVPG